MVVGWASISFLTASTAIVQVQAAPEMRGRVLALQAIVFLGSTPIGGPIVGFVSQEWARAGIAAGCLRLPLRRRVRHRRRPPRRTSVRRSAGSTTTPRTRTLQVA